MQEDDGAAASSDQGLELASSPAAALVCGGEIPSTSEKVSTGAATGVACNTGLAAAELVEASVDATIADDEEKKKKKKKKKKAVEEEKKPKGPGKLALSKIKKMQAALEEEKLRREQECLAAQREEEEMERQRLENVHIA